MKTYTPMTVQNLIDALAERPDDQVIRDLSVDTGSYRGYYKHVYIAPGAGVTAKALREHLAGKLHSTMEGYKGGEFNFSPDSYVFIAEYGDTGPALVGFDGDEPVTADEGWFF